MNIDIALEFIENLSPFIQGVLGSAAFAVLLWIARVVTRGLGKTGKSYFKVISHDLVMKHILHKRFINSDNLYSQIWANFFALRQALRGFIKASAMFVFFAGVNALLEGNWLLLAGLFLALNGLIEAGSWLKDTSDEKHISHLDQEVRDELLNKHLKTVNESDSSRMANKSLNSQASPAGTSKDGAH